MGKDQKDRVSAEERQAAQDAMFDQAFGLKEAIAQKLTEDGTDSISGEQGVYTRIGEYVYLGNFKDPNLLRLARNKTDKTPQELAGLYENKYWDNNFWEEDAKLIIVGGVKLTQYISPTDFESVGDVSSGFKKPIMDQKALPKAQSFLEGVIAGEPTAEPVGQ